MPNGFGPPPLLNPKEPNSLYEAVQYLTMVALHNYEQLNTISQQWKTQFELLEDSVHTNTTRLNAHDNHHGLDDVNIAKRTAVAEYREKQRQSVIAIFKGPVWKWIGIPLVGLGGALVGYLGHLGLRLVGIDI